MSVPFRRRDVIPDKKQIDLLFKLMLGSVPVTGDDDEARMARHLAHQSYARIVPHGNDHRAIATLEGVDLFRRYYNALDRDDALRKHQQETGAAGCS